MTLSVVMPAHNEAGSIVATLVGVVTALEQEGIDHEVVVVDDASTDGTRQEVEEVARAHPSVRCHPSHNPPGFGFAVRAGLDVYRGEAVAIVVADLSDDPKDLVRYHRLLEEGFDCAFGSRFVPGGRINRYPKLKLVINRIVNFGIRVLFQHGYNDTTNAFKAYRREVIDGVRPLLSNHFKPDGRAAAEGDRTRLPLRDRSDLLDEPRDRRVQALAEGDGQPLPLHRAHVFLEHYSAEATITWQARCHAAGA